MAIDKVVAAIAHLLATPMTLDLPAPPAVTVGVGAPGGPAKTKDLVLFLYLVTPDGAQRNQDRVRPFPTATTPPAMVTQVVRPAVPLELRFLVTLGGSGDDNPAMLSRLAHAIRALESASPLSLPADFQQAIWLSLIPMETDELSRLWGLFPDTNCRPCFAFRAGPVWIDPLRIEPVAGPVTHDEFASSRLEASA